MLTPNDAESLVGSEIVIEEKIDGANIGLSVREPDQVRVQSRGNYLDSAHAHPQFRPLWPWLQVRDSDLVEALGLNRILFGEWCYAVHSVAYTRLPDWFLGFDVYDRAVGKFWDTCRRDDLLSKVGLCSVPQIARGQFELEDLIQLLGSTSSVGQGAIEGLVVRQERDGFTTARAKLVRPEFAEAITRHWSRSTIRRNELTKGAASWP